MENKNTTMLDAWFEQKLEERKSGNLLRRLTTSQGLIDFTSNDYLGLSRSATLFEQIQRRTEEIVPRLNGATGSRLLSGNATYTESVEAMLAGIFKAEASLIFNSGYAANLAVLSSIPQRGDTILYDELAHACIKDGARLSMAKRFSFKHNDLNDLESKLKRAEGKVYIAVESVYSMDGDQAPLQNMVSLCEQYGAYLLIDEAHSTGVMGQHGSGMAVAQELQDRIAVRVYTFGKAMGIHGACVAGSKQLIQYLVNFARPFIYTTALSPHSIASIECAFQYLDKNIFLQDQLQQNVQQFVAWMKDFPDRTVSNTSIQTVLIPGNTAVRNVATLLQQKGFDVRPILSPTVPAGAERLRICLHTFNTAEEIRDLTLNVKAASEAFSEKDSRSTF